MPINPSFAYSTMGRFKRKLFGIPPAETRVERRGFEVADPAVRNRIEDIGAAFVEGYHAALLESEPQGLAEALDRSPLEIRGFVYEGAAMGLRIGDFFTPWRSRFREFLEGPGVPHAYMVHVGAGWALARLPLPAGLAVQRLDPLLRWLVFDGYGFHQGYFHWRKTLLGQRRPRWQGYALNAFDQGLGRSLWFVKGGDPATIAETVAAFPTGRRGDLWSGVGLAAAYAGGVGDAELKALRWATDEFRTALAQGAAFAAKARQRAGNPAAHTESACRIFCEMSGEAAAAVTDQALEGLPPDGEYPAYEYWRRRIQDRFAQGEPT